MGVRLSLPAPKTSHNRAMFLFASGSVDHLLPKISKKDDSQSSSGLVSRHLSSSGFMSSDKSVALKLPLHAAVITIDG